MSSIIDNDDTKKAMSCGYGCFIQRNNVKIYEVQDLKITVEKTLIKEVKDFMYIYACRFCKVKAR